GIGDRAIVLVQTFLRGLVVVRRHRQDSVHPDRRHLLCQRNHLRGVITASSRQHRHALRGHFDGYFHHAKMFFACQRRTFSGGPAGHEEIHTFVDLPLNQAPQRRFIQRTVPLKRSHHRCPASREHVVLLLPTFRKLATIRSANRRPSQPPPDSVRPEFRGTQT